MFFFVIEQYSNLQEERVVQWSPNIVSSQVLGFGLTVEQQPVSNIQFMTKLAHIKGQSRSSSTLIRGTVYHFMILDVYIKNNSWTYKLQVWIERFLSNSKTAPSERTSILSTMQMPEVYKEKNLFVNGFSRSIWMPNQPGSWTFCVGVSSPTARQNQYRLHQL